MPRGILLSLMVVGILSATGTCLMAQGVPTVQQSQFRSQWVGEQVDQIPLGGSISPLNGLGAIVGSLQTPDEVQREVDAAMSGVKAKSPFVFKPSLGVGWEINNQGNQSTNRTVQTSATGVRSTNSNVTYSTASTPFVAPAAALLYNRDHGPWNISSGFSVGYKYFTNPDFVANGDGSQRNPLSITGLFSAILEMSRYILDSLITASYGNGYDTTSGSNNTQTTVSGNMGFKYLLSSSSAFAFKAGYNIAHYSGSAVTPNNNTSTFFANLSPIYELSDKTHLSTIFGIGQSAQALQQSSTQVTNGTNTATVPIVAKTQTATRNYAQAMAKVKYDFTSKLVFDVGLGARYITSQNINNAIDDGVKPAWALGFAYTPTAKTSVTFSAGQQGSDIRPQVNLLVNWIPREKTQISLGANQSEQFANSLTSQYLVSRGFVLTINEQLFNSVALQLSGGYTTQTYIVLSGNQNAKNLGDRQNGYLPDHFVFANASLTWKIRDYLNLVNTVYYNSGQSANGYNNSVLSQMWYSISLNFAL